MCDKEKEAMSILSSSSSKLHLLLFPFMSKGHIIPFLQLARLLLRRGVHVTLLTTPANHPFIAQSLSGADVSILDLDFPENIPGIPPGIESTDKLPSMSLFIPFVNGTKLMQPSFEEAIHTIIPKVNCIISDMFFGWTLGAASKFGIPRLSFYCMSFYTMAVVEDVMDNGLLSLHESGDETFTVTSFPWIRARRNEFDHPFNKRDPTGPDLDFILECKTATNNSYGMLVNTFCELEEPFVEYWNRKLQPKTWCIGPLCLAEPSKIDAGTSQKPKWRRWLDEKLTEGSPVLYVAFGSQISIPAKQLHEIAVGLEESRVSFLWVVRNAEEEPIHGFEDRVKKRGIIVREWVDQKEILEHEIVQGFLSHCGWNSVLEAICAAVPILAWPMMAEQRFNAKMLVEEIKIGLRVVGTDDGTSNGFVTNENLKSSVIKLMECENGKALKKVAKGVAEAAKRAAAEGGSSWHAVSRLIAEIHGQKEIKSSYLA
ncbi:UDP-glycosyltransferase 90A1 [Primulina tabacum]|uniref:UDP-glycosyltransferase 90A1 n=1 Tax=Primulina tabacum TaxID=48773 RepID=UPI003F59320C